MDFTNRSAPTQNQDIEHIGAPTNSGVSGKRPNNSSNKLSKTKWGSVGVLAALIAVVILIIALIVLVAANNNTTKDRSEVSYVKTSKLQAVFLNTGQVYFGNITSLNNNYLILTNIFYLQTASGSSSTTSTSASNVSLVKLGCELHRPYDQMVINRGQVTFWENLQSDGQVATAVATYQKDNPGPQKCADQSTSSSTTSGNAAQSATSGNAATTPTTTTGGQ
jgi:hypothetical protein